MIRSLMHLFCLALALTLPAINAHACHPVVASHTAMGMPAMSGLMHHQHQGPDTPISASHDCIGCIAPLDIAAYAPDRQPNGLRPALSILRTTPDLSSCPAAPEPPPPRSVL